MKSLMLVKTRDAEIARNITVLMPIVMKKFFSLPKLSRFGSTLNLPRVNLFRLRAVQQDVACELMGF